MIIRGVRTDPPLTRGERERPARRGGGRARAGRGRGAAARRGPRREERNTEIENTLAQYAVVPYILRR